MKNKIGTAIKNIIIFLPKENVKLIPYISDGLCTGCYFWPDKTGKMDFDELNRKYKSGFHCSSRKLVPSCSNYSVNNTDFNVIFKEKSNRRK
jgi:hypothetical protein